MRFGDCLFNLPRGELRRNGEVVKLTTASKPKQFDVCYELFAAEAKARQAYRFAIAHANAPERAEAVAERIRNDFPEARMYINDVAAVMGAHIGPGAIVMSFLGR